VLGAAAGLLGAFEAAEALKFLDGAGELTAGRLLSMDAKRMRFSVIPLKRDAACALCGDNPSITSMEGGNCPG
jgi:molybdopterin/thiamine biosynthesis adenylyltransferase